jgi:2-phosphoglycerate kinase
MTQGKDVTVIMVGGPSASGKSTLAESLAARFGMTCVDLDLFYVAFREVIPRQVAPPGLHSEAESFWAKPVDELVASYTKLQDYMSPALERVVSTQVAKGKRLVIEGAWVLPAFAARSEFNGVEADVRSLFLFEPDPLETERRRRRRTYPWMRTSAEDVMRNVTMMRYHHSLEMKRRAEQLGLPVLESRPFETLEARALAALGLDG